MTGGSPERKFEMKESKLAEGKSSEAKSSEAKSSEGRDRKDQRAGAALAPTELSQLLTKIGAASRVLNGAANEATRRIEEVEQCLLDAEPGVSVWGATLLVERASHQRDEAGLAEPAQRVVTLGFARSKKDRWGICVREELKVENGLGGSEELSLLRKADRNLRILALPHLEQLVRQVLAVLEQQLMALDAAREAVKPAVMGAVQPTLQSTGASA
jgi:hypothetical protein